MEYLFCNPVAIGTEPQVDVVENTEGEVSLESLIFEKHCLGKKVLEMESSRDAVNQVLSQLKMAIESLAFLQDKHDSLSVQAKVFDEQFQVYYEHVTKISKNKINKFVKENLYSIQSSMHNFKLKRLNSENSKGPVVHREPEFHNKKEVSIFCDLILHCESLQCFQTRIFGPQQPW